MIFTSLYIHIPFCVHRCGYCDFNTYSGLEGLIPAYVKAVCRELAWISQWTPGPIRVHTIYFGGGTPSLVAPGQISDILACIHDNFECSPSLEITLEANPGTVSSESLGLLRRAGVNRLSLGMQSSHADELQLLERVHSFDDVTRAVNWARQAGFGNLNLDLIFGLPNQSLEAWLASLETALALQTEHLSLYALTLEHGTPLFHKVEAGILPNPDADLAADMYEAARERLQTAGYFHYEISNWARFHENGLAYSCEHNLQYWRMLPYLGIGAGSHGFFDHYRTVNVAAPNAYITRMADSPDNIPKPGGKPLTPATIQSDYVDRETEMGEVMMMGLRLVDEGVLDSDFLERFGMSLHDRYPAEIERLESYDLLEWAGEQAGRLRLTRKGHLLGNQVFKEFI